MRSLRERILSEFDRLEAGLKWVSIHLHAFGYTEEENKIREAVRHLNTARQLFDSAIRSLERKVGL